MQWGETHGTNVRRTLLTTSTLTRKSTTVALAALSCSCCLGFCDVVRLSAKREEKIAQRWSPSFSRMKSAANGSSLEIAFSDFCRCNVRVSARRN